MCLGMTLYIVGGVTASQSERYSFSPFFGAGIGVTLVGSLTFSIGCCIIQYRRAVSLRKLVAEESMRYSTRLPIPCSWRLETATYFFGGYGNQRNRQHISRVSLPVIIFDIVCIRWTLHFRLLSILAVLISLAMQFFIINKVLMKRKCSTRHRITLNLHLIRVHR